MLSVKPGARLKSAVCATEVMVVKGSGELDLRCGGVPLTADGAGGGDIQPGFDGGTQIGKRYTNDDASVELLCTKPGDGGLSIGEVALGIKQAENLPSSD